ncbi:MAG: hypothetical protein WB973_04775 [Thermoanaerobaculia bacterium]
MNQILIVSDINPMYYGTLSFLMFSGMLLSIGFWALHNLKKEKKRRIGFTPSDSGSRSRSAD